MLSSKKGHIFAAKGSPQPQAYWMPARGDLVGSLGLFCLCITRLWRAKKVPRLETGGEERGGFLSIL